MATEITWTDFQRDEYGVFAQMLAIEVDDTASYVIEARQKRDALLAQVDWNLPGAEESADRVWSGYRGFIAKHQNSTATDLAELERRVSGMVKIADKIIAALPLSERPGWEAYKAELLALPSKGLPCVWPERPAELKETA